MKHIHFIGICGVAMSALAIAFKKAGFEVSGSDAGFFPPVSTNLEKNKITFYPGWHPEKMSTPNLVIVGNVASSTNPEWQAVQTKKLNYLSYPEAIAKYFVKENSIVCAGTYGKTTTSALLSFILTQTGFNPSYMFGGLTVNDFASAALTDSKYSILEGDEYKTARWDNGAKFLHYSPTHLLLTAVEWDHADLYPTATSYFSAFNQLLKMIPATGLLVASENVMKNANLDLTSIKSPLKTYGKSAQNDYVYSDVKMTTTGIKFNILHKEKVYQISSPLIGDYMAENIVGAFALAHTLGVEANKIIEAIKNFIGLKRRLEKRLVGKITVFDDIAHSPAKIMSVLKNLRQIYQQKIICVFEPNTGNRQPASIPSYNHAFKDADEVIIPKLTKLKTSENMHHFDEKELTNIISATHSNVKNIDNDDNLVKYLSEQTDAIVVFCGSHGFRGMIESLIK